MTQGPLDALLDEGRDPLVLLDRPGVLDTWDRLSEEKAIWWLVALAWDARGLTLPVWGRYSTAGFYAEMLQALALRADKPAEVASSLRSLELLDPRTCVGAGLLLLAAWRTEIRQRLRDLTRVCPYCRQEMRRPRRTEFIRWPREAMR